MIGYNLSYIAYSNDYVRVYGHFSHLAHYNGSGKGVAGYYVYQQLEPEFTKPNEETRIQFSVQDTNEKDVKDITAMVEIYSTLTGERLLVFPWTFLKSGDFEIPYIFSKSGNYQIVISILNKDVDNNKVLSTVPPERTILYDNVGCDCERVVFNVTISQSFGDVFTYVMFGAILGVFAIIGGVLVWIFLSRRKSKTHPISNYEFIKYSVLFLALGASIVHLSVYADHAGLRLEYSIFLIAASGGQLFYGLVYIILNFSDDRLGIKKKHRNFVSKDYYRKSFILNWIGLGGSLVLILLYIYSIIFPPPLSPNAIPEDVDLAGIIDKALEIVLVTGIIFLMRAEKRKYLYSVRTFGNRDTKSRGTKDQ
ncbi:MAG: hypothetical protein AB7V56_04930 [Candidatus Nitrosocosmicus sp.]